VTLHVELVSPRRGEAIELAGIEIGRDHRRAFGHIGSHTACMVHVVMSQDEILDRLAGVLRFCRVDDPARLQLAIRRVEDHQMILKLDDQVVGCSAFDMLNVRRKLDQLEAAAVGENDVVTVVESRQEEPPHDPLIGHIARCWRLGRRLNRLGHGKRVGRDSGIGGDVPIVEFCYIDVTDPKRQRLGDLRPADRFPVREHEIVVRIAVDVVVIPRADGGRQMSLAIEQDRECRRAVSEGDRRQ